MCQVSTLRDTHSQRIIQTESHESPSFLRKVHRLELDPPALSHTGGFRVGGGVHDSYTFQCGLGDILLPLA